MREHWCGVLTLWSCAARKPGWKVGGELKENRGPRQPAEKFGGGWGWRRTVGASLEGEARQGKTRQGRTKEARLVHWVGFGFGFEWMSWW
jgi:hypothetical protein